MPSFIAPSSLSLRAAAFAGLFAALVLAPPAARAEAQAPADAVLLFVASWCAPCYGELRALPAISRAAAPARVFVVPVDAGRATDRMMARVPAQQRLALAPADAAALMRRLAGTAPGLPISVATGPKGDVCAVLRRPLAPRAVAALRALCGKTL